MSEMPIVEAGGELSRVAHQTAASRQVIYLVEHGERLAAIVPADMAASIELEEQRKQARKRLAAVALLADIEPVDRERPDEEAVAAARARAGRGRPLSDYVSDGR